MSPTLCGRGGQVFSLRTHHLLMVAGGRERERLTLREGDKEEDTLTHPEVREGLGRTLIHQKNSLKTVNVAPEHTYHL